MKEIWLVVSQVASFLWIIIFIAIAIGVVISICIYFQKSWEHINIPTTVREIVPEQRVGQFLLRAEIRKKVKEGELFAESSSGEYITGGDIWVCRYSVDHLLNLKDCTVNFVRVDK